MNDLNWGTTVISQLSSFRDNNFPPLEKSKDARGVQDKIRKQETIEI